MLPPKFEPIRRGDRSPLAGTPCECHYAGTTPSLTPDAIEKAMGSWEINGDIHGNPEILHLQ
jgi:hypothetical protein